MISIERLPLFPFQRILAHHHDVRNYSQAKPITLGVVGCPLVLALKYLRSHVGQSTTFLELTLFFQVQSHPEIDYSWFHRVQVHNNILRLDVSMDDLLLVALFQPFSDAGDDGPDIFLTHGGTVVDDSHEISALDVVSE